MPSFLRPRAPVVVVLLVSLAFLLLLVLPARLVEYLWFDNLGYEQVFWRTLGLKAGLFLLGFIVAGGYLALNFWYILRHYSQLRWNITLDVERRAPEELELTPERLRLLAAGVTVLVGLFFATHFSSLYDSVLRFISSARLGVEDPIFGKDVAFYLLKLPLLSSLRGILLTISLLAIALSIGTYMWMGSVAVDKGRLLAPRPVVRQLSLNIAVFIAFWGLGYVLQRYSLLFESSGTVHGISYIDHNVVIPALWVMIVATVVLIVLLVVNLRKAQPRLLGVGVVGYFGLMIIGLFVIPALVQRFSVEPNELALELPYLEHNIQFTRQAYGLEDVAERDYPATNVLTYDDIIENQSTINNIRLWDPRLLIQTYRQIQEIRTYYQFYNVDIDRYVIDGEIRQLMLSARELAQNLPDRADTWINRHLQYTHGFGITMNEVAEVGPEGNPQLLVRDLPPVSEVEEIPVDRPSIYYGEAIPTYRIVNTEVPELAYPSGDENVYTHYSGSGGVLLSSFWRRLLFAFYHGDTNIVLSDLINPDSRIQFWNRVQERVRRIAPFLRLDADPYLVVTPEGGLVWIQDAYTTARTYPYSELEVVHNLNYIRNSVKIVIDAYEGSVDFYVMDEDDPIVLAYKSFYPMLFRDGSEMPEELIPHRRYPQDMFDIQVSKFVRYHMTIPQVFYNNEDLWTRPREQYGGGQVEMDPYYVLTKLPEEDEVEFLLMTPLTPENRDNMIAWLAARNDGDHYGELVVYKLPKERLIYGPNQIESRIDQNTEISQQLALWDQRGSRVIRGNLMVIPIEGTFLYVEPVFMIAQGMEIPQLRRVVALYGERVAMEETLDLAVAAVFDANVDQLIARSDIDLDSVPHLESLQTRQELRRARDVLQRALQSLQSGDFSGFGRGIEDLQRILDASENEEQIDSPDDAASVEVN